MGQYIHWQISIYDLATDTWGEYSNIKNPDTTAIPFLTTSTVEVVRLADGGEAMVLPETKSLRDAFSVEWNRVESGHSLLGDIKDYTENSSGVRLQTHTEIYDGVGLDVIEGRFIDYTISMEPKRDYLSRQLFGVKATFKPITIIAGTGF